MSVRQLTLLERSHMDGTTVIDPFVDETGVCRVDPVQIKMWCIDKAHELDLCDDRFGYAKALYAFVMTGVTDITEFEVRRPRKTAKP